MAKQNNLGTQGQGNMLKGRLNQAIGKVQSMAGNMFGNKKMQADGNARQAGGKIQEVFGTGEQKVDEVLTPNNTTV
jgi:uncharacterized protein YjbJ (UPF0337 family)